MQGIIETSEKIYNVGLTLSPTEEIIIWIFILATFIILGFSIYLLWHKIKNAKRF